MVSNASILALFTVHVHVQILLRWNIAPPYVPNSATYLRVTAQNIP